MSSRKHDVKGYINFFQNETLREAEQHLEQAVFLYNYKCPHLSCDMQSRNEAHSSWGPLERRWKNYYKPPVAVSAE